MDKKEDKRAIMKTFILFLFCFFMAMNPVFAVEVAPKISDREIIESLNHCTLNPCTLNPVKGKKCKQQQKEP